MNVQDVIFLVIIILFVQWKAFNICRHNPAISELFKFIAIGIILWAMYAFFSDAIVFWVFGLSPADEVGHDAAGKLIALHLQIGGLSYALAEHPLRWGNSAYQFMVGLAYYLFGFTYTSIQLFNGLMAAWGGVILLDLISRAARVRRTPRWILFITVFFPSIIFWTTSNLKEGLMFWSICMSMNTMKSKPSFRTIFGVVVAILTMIVLRPHIALIWIGSIGAVAFVKQGKRRYAAPAMIFLIIAIFATSEHTQSRGGWLTELSTVELLEKNYDQQKTKYANAGSTVITESSKPIPFVSGFLMIFFRPYIWEINSIKYAVAALESWGIAFLMGYVLYKSRDPVALFRGNRMMMLSGVVLVLFIFLFSFQGNLGILVRYKVQALPAMLTIIDIPLLQMQSQKLFLLQSSRNAMRVLSNEKT